MIYVDADACPVRDETVRVAERHGQRVSFVTNGGLRPSRHPLATVVVVEEDADAADKWIAERIGPGTSASPPTCRWRRVASSGARGCWRRTERRSRPRMSGPGWRCAT